MDDKIPEAPRDGWVAWAAAVGLVLGWDVYAKLYSKETASAAYGRALQDPLWRWPVALATTYLLAHLGGRPRSLKKYDPLIAVGKHIHPVERSSLAPVTSISSRRASRAQRSTSSAPAV